MFVAKAEVWMSQGTTFNPTVQYTLKGSVHTLPSRAFISNLEIFRIMKPVQQLVLGGAVSGLLFGIAACIIYSKWITAEAKKATRDREMRGSQVVNARILSKFTAKLSNHRSLSIADVQIPIELETRHIAVVGSTGSGKTTCIRQLLDKIEQRGDAALVFDTSGEFISNYYSPKRGDVILSPFDKRGPYWDIFSEIEHPSDVDNIAARIVPRISGHDDSIWTQSASMLVANIIRSLWLEGRTELPLLLSSIQNMPKAELKNWLSHTSSSRSFETDAEKATASILFNLSMTASVLQFLKTRPGDSGEFSFRHYYKSLDSIEGPRPWIFVPRREDQFEAMAPLLSCWLECAAAAILGLDPHPSRRIWMILDELPDIPKVQNLQRLLPLGRKFGASIILTFQAIGQMNARYGPDTAAAMLGCCNTKVFLQLIDPESRKWASDTIGQVEAEVRGATESLALQMGQGRTSLGSQRLLRPAVLESEFRLPKFHGFLQLPDGLPTAKIILTNDHIVARGPATHPAFVPGDVADTLWSEMATPPSSGPILPEGGPI